MSHFLENIIQCHMGVGSIVRPRIRARFEAERGVTFMPHASFVPITDQEETIGLKQKNSRQTILPNAPLSNEEQAPQNTERNPVRSVLASHYIQRSEKGTAAILLRQKETETAEPDTIRIQKPRSLKTSKPVEKSDQGNEHALSDVHPKKTRRIDEVITSHKQHVTNSNHGSVQPDTQHIKGPVSDKTRPAPGQGIAITPVSPAYSQRLNSSLSLHSRQPLGIKGGWPTDRLSNHIKTNEIEPVINVTIGRIEVRANQSQAPEQTRKKKKPSGVMSLDHYLKQRTQGGNP